MSNIVQTFPRGGNYNAGDNTINIDNNAHTIKVNEASSADINEIINPKPGAVTNNLQMFTFTIPANSSASYIATVTGVTSDMDGIIGLRNPTENQKAAARACHYNFALGNGTITATRGYGPVQTQTLPCMFICTGKTGSGVINAFPQAGRMLTRNTIVAQDVHLTTTESSIVISDSIAALLSDETLKPRFVMASMGSGNSGFDSPPIWLLNSVDVNDSTRRYAHKFYLGTYVTTLQFSADYKTLYAKSNTTATNIQETYFRGLYYYCDI